MVRRLFVRPALQTGYRQENRLFRARFWANRAPRLYCPRLRADETEEFMNAASAGIFPAKLLKWREDVLKESDETLMVGREESLQIGYERPGVVGNRPID